MQLNKNQEDQSPQFIHKYFLNFLDSGLEEKFRVFQSHKLSNILSILYFVPAVISFVILLARVIESDQEMFLANVIMNTVLFIVFFFGSVLMKLFPSQFDFIHSICSIIFSGLILFSLGSIIRDGKIDLFQQHILDNVKSEVIAIAIGICIYFYVQGTQIIVKAIQILVQLLFMILFLLSSSHMGAAPIIGFIIFMSFVFMKIFSDLKNQKMQFYIIQTLTFQNQVKQVMFQENQLVNMITFKAYEQNISISDEQQQQGSPLQDSKGKGIIDKQYDQLKSPMGSSQKAFLGFNHSYSIKDGEVRNSNEKLNQNIFYDLQNKNKKIQEEFGISNNQQLQGLLKAIRVYEKLNDNNSSQQLQSIKLSSHKNQFDKQQSLTQTINKENQKCHSNPQWQQIVPVSLLFFIQGWISEINQKQTEKNVDIINSQQIHKSQQEVQPSQLLQQSEQQKQTNKQKKITGSSRQSLNSSQINLINSHNENLYTVQQNAKDTNQQKENKCIKNNQSIDFVKKTLIFKGKIQSFIGSSQNKIDDENIYQFQIVMLKEYQIGNEQEQYDQYLINNQNSIKSIILCNLSFIKIHKNQEIVIPISNSFSIQSTIYPKKSAFQKSSPTNLNSQDVLYKQEIDENAEYQTKGENTIKAEQNHNDQEDEDYIADEGIEYQQNNDQSQKLQNKEQEQFYLDNSDQISARNEMFGIPVENVNQQGVKSQMQSFQTKNQYDSIDSRSPQILGTPIYQNKIE